MKAFNKRKEDFMVDLKLEELFQYNGRGKKPEKFDEFWEKELSRIDSCPLEYQIEKIDIPSNVASCYRLTFNSFDGTQISCQLLKPKHLKAKSSGMLFFHGYHVNSGDFSEKIGWAAEGFVVLAMDCRGQGGLSENKEPSVKGSSLKGFIIRGVEEGPESLYYKRVYLDTVIAAKILMSLDDVDEDNISVQGASQGGALALVCAALEPRIKKAFVMHPFLSDYRRAFELDIKNSAYEELYYWFKFRDPLHEKEETFFETLEYIDLQHFASKIKAKVILATGLDDEICFPSTQFSVFNKIDSSKDVIVLPEYGHEHYPKISDKVRGFFIDDKYDGFNQSK